MQGNAHTNDTTARPATLRWTAREDGVLARYYPALGSRGIKRLGKLKHRSNKQICERAHHIRLRRVKRYPRWTRCEDLVLAQDYWLHGLHGCGRRLKNRCADDLRKRARVLGLSKMDRVVYRRYCCRYWCTMEDMRRWRRTVYRWAQAVHGPKLPVPLDRMEEMAQYGVLAEHAPIVFLNQPGDGVRRAMVAVGPPKLSPKGRYCRGPRIEAVLHFTLEMADGQIAWARRDTTLMPSTNLAHVLIETCAFRHEALDRSCESGCGRAASDATAKEMMAEAEAFSSGLRSVAVFRWEGADTQAFEQISRAKVMRVVRQRARARARAMANFKRPRDDQREMSRTQDALQQRQ